MERFNFPVGKMLSKVSFEYYYDGVYRKSTFEGKLEHSVSIVYPVIAYYFYSPGVGVYNPLGYSMSVDFGIPEKGPGFNVCGELVAITLTFSTGDEIKLNKNSNDLRMESIYSWNNTFGGSRCSVKFSFRESTT